VAWDSSAGAGANGPACVGFTVLAAAPVPDIYLDVTPGPLAPGGAPTWTAFAGNIAHATGDPQIDAASDLTRPSVDLYLTPGQTFDPASLRCIRIAGGADVPCSAAAPLTTAGGGQHIVISLADGSMPAANGGRQVRVQFRTVVDPLIDLAQVRIDSYLSSDNNPLLTTPRPAVPLGGSLVPDSTDANDNGFADGATTEWIATAAARVAVNVAATLASVKTAQGALDAQPVVGGAGAAAHTVDGGPVTYGLALRNTSPSASATGIVLYDVLPHPGDTGVVATQAGTARGSDFAVHLTGPPTVTGPSGVVADAVVEYSTFELPCRPEVGVTTGCVDDWTATAPGDLTTVTAVRIALPSTTLARGQRVDVSVPAQVPTGVATGQRAQNSFGYAALLGPARVSAEPAKVGVIVAGHGVQVSKTDSADGTPLAGAVFELRRGPAATDPLVSTLTTEGSGGTAAATVYAAGEYCLREVTAPRGYRISFQPVCRTLALDGDTWQVAATDDAMRFAIGNQVWSDLDRDGVHDAGEPGLAGVTATLLDDQGRPVSQTTTDSDGFYRFDQLPAGSYQVAFSGLASGDRFTHQGVGSDPGVDSDAGLDGRTVVVVLRDGEPGVEVPAAGSGIAADLADETIDTGVVVASTSPPSGPTDPTDPTDPGSTGPTQPVVHPAVAVPAAGVPATGELAYTGPRVDLRSMLLTIAEMLLAGTALLAWSRRRERIRH
jgi:hypothetical protein